MKKLFSILFVLTMLGMVFTACGDDKDEPKVPETQNLVSVHENDETDTYYVFDIDMTKDKSAIYMHNMEFGAPFKMTLRVNVPVSLNQSGDAYIMSGSNIVAEMQRGGSWTPMTDEKYQLNNLKCTVNPSAKTFSISFDSHGGHFEDNGKLR